MNRLTKRVYFSLLFKEKLNIRFLTGFQPYAVIVCQSVRCFTFELNGVVSYHNFGPFETSVDII